MAQEQSMRDHDDTGPVSSRERLDAIFEECYAEIKQRIHQALRRESHPTLQTTDIVHEIYLRLVESQGLSFEDRRAVLNLIALKTREYLVDRARRRKALKRGGGRVFVSLTFAQNVGRGQPVDILLLNDALEKLATRSRRAAEIAHLRLFVGLSEREIVSVIGCHRSTVQRLWEFAKLWLTDAMSSTHKQDDEAPHDR
jgi:RNA polymerase sigma factor (TIGR02999 family)